MPKVNPKDNRATKGERKLVTGEMVREFIAQHEVGPVVSHCPDKWLTIDLETGQAYMYDSFAHTWVAPSVKINARVKEMIINLRPK